MTTAVGTVGKPVMQISWKKGEASDAEDKKGETYIINENTDKFHKPDCSSVSDMKARNKKEFSGNREELLEQGYSPCGRCQP
mgnify:CR=1 FL=1